MKRVTPLFWPLIFSRQSEFHGISQGFEDFLPEINETNKAKGHTHFYTPKKLSRFPLNSFPKHPKIRQLQQKRRILSSHKYESQKSTIAQWMIDVRWHRRFDVTHGWTQASWHWSLGCLAIKFGGGILQTKNFRGVFFVADLCTLRTNPSQKHTFEADDFPFFPKVG